ncbi:CPBP family intramembrane metalloprotease [Candidatus Roizmanbacteria bacterium]|nr:CPBP family intramembrane metalloprotease [Candidatus Roizmanbacteria bacterium]
MKSKVTPTQRALNLWAIVLIIWAIYRAKFKMPEWFDEFIAKPSVFILPVYYYVTKVEKKAFLEAINLKLKFILSDLMVAFSIGGVFVLSAILANFIKFKKFIFLQQTFNPQDVLLIVAIALATGISEEILSRGFILKRLYEESKNIYTSSFFASILFFFLHIPILFTKASITGNLLLTIMGTDLALSLINSFIFLETRNLIVPILIHAFYNLSIVFFL